MKQKPLKLGVFASSDSLMKAILDVREEYEDIDFLISGKSLDDALEEGQKMIRQGVEAIISRRGTAHLLRQHLKVPIVSLPHFTVELIASLRKASAYGRKVLLPCFGDDLIDLGTLSKLLNIEIVQGYYTDKKSLFRSVEWGKQQGCSVALGGNRTREAAQAVGLPFVEIAVSHEEVRAAIENARSVAISNRAYRTLASHYQGILDAASEGIIAVDVKGTISAANRVARRIFSGKITEGYSLLDIFPSRRFLRPLAEGQAIMDVIEEIEGQKYLVSRIPIFNDDEVVGGIYFFKEIGEVLEAEKAVRRVLARGLVAKYNFSDIIYASSLMNDVVETAKQFAMTDSTVLLVGETGTGKELFAHSIHNSSSRKKGPFVTVNCAALPESLLESELFGYEEGAFTGSRKGGKAGRFEMAHRGTIFLDEIDSTPQQVQIRLLRILQEKEVIRIGGDRKIPIDVRVVAASSRDLMDVVKNGTFRSDLFFRLNVLKIEIPPLRQRPEDILVLLEHFIHVTAKQYGLKAVTLPPHLLDRLMRYSWPGNVRQLRNFAERLVLTSNLPLKNQGVEKLVNELMASDSDRPLTGPEACSPPLSTHSIIDAKKNEIEKALIRNTLEQCRWNRTLAARQLGISRTTLWRKIKLFGIQCE
ncbi:sigma 54-interacting transcriptional regulator [Thermodesulforhabdus norvegica]|uniref:Transcriptional regulator containing PAS, AAA-type ATPase, and DNA-binding Fis domains n=1 Tax=Thermodesulforhabdus norvegica TaxID=39841 RepID=A0A1I4QGC6_9BACT|nr:sigma 54-interacting transcriptional regulator [Thermodesulforhabdus norvegica]SFM38826.1 Transcriptional regulator containing PAS, AAA-type ATPase, and DNA-binding Fis domains [Thermodesulforhabdus norvegica]